MIRFSYECARLRLVFDAFLQMLSYKFDRKVNLCNVDYVLRIVAEFDCS
jgi:hypothetical protein